jgi:hypothetical protein
MDCGHAHDGLSAVMLQGQKGGVKLKFAQGTGVAASDMPRACALKVVEARYAVEIK